MLPIYRFTREPYVHNKFNVYLITFEVLLTINVQALTIMLFI